MATKESKKIPHPVLKLIEVQALRATDDQVLLQQFVQANNEAAFRVIVERHGPMMFGVCLRVLKCPYDAEDALQAAFLVFSQRANSIYRASSLASWLHGVALRVAGKLRRERSRRTKRERGAARPEVSDSPDELTWSEVKNG